MAIALSAKKVQATNGIMLLYSFIALLITNSIILMIINALFPLQVVLGTFSISYWWAIYHSMLKLSVITLFAIPVVTYYEWKKNVIFTSKQWIITYFFVNLIAIYSITRFADNLGLGVSSWMVVAALAFVFDMAQGVVMMGLGKMIKIK